MHASPASATSSLGRLRTLLVTSLVVAAGCAPVPGGARDPEALPAADEATESTAQHLRVEITPHAAAYDYAHRNNLITSAAGDRQIVFVTEALNGAVVALDRFTGHEVGRLPAPPDGWLLPFSLRVPRDGHVVVLDPGGFPSPTTPAIPRVYDYDFTYNPFTRTFSATLTRAVRFDGLPAIFAEDVEVTSTGDYVVSESILGALWVVRPDGTVTFGVFPSSGVPIPELAPCAFPPTTVGGIPFATAGNFGPGALALAERAGQLYVSTTCNGGVYRIPMASLTDPTRTPEQRASDITLVSPRPAGVAESLHGLAFNRFNPSDDRLYASDSLQLRIVRINTTTGARQVIADDPVLFNFPSKLQFLPPVAGLTPLVVASDQEHRLPAINAAITTDLTSAPWIVAKVYVF